MTNGNRSRNGTRVAIFGVKISLFVLAAILSYGSARCQGQPLRLEWSVAPHAVHYHENEARKDGPELTGNSFAIVPLHMEAQFDLDDALRLPLWLALSAEFPLASSSGREVGNVTRSGSDYVTQREDADYRQLRVGGAVGLAILPFLQPYLTFEFNRFSSRRTNQQIGQEDGSLQPDPNQDYTETVRASFLGVGSMSVIPLADNMASRLRLNVAYLNAQGVAVSNTYFGEGSWGQHSSGYEIKARMAFETVAGFLSSDRNSYVTIGVDAVSERWNGDGRVGAEIFSAPFWPPNTVTELGAFAGIGLFF